MDESVLPSIRQLEETHWWFRARLEIISGMVEREVDPGSRILDIGCGTGKFLERISRRFDSFGLDMSPIAIRFCREKGLNQVRLGSIENLQEAFAEKFDAVTMWDVLEHTEDDVGTLERVRQALQPNGLLLLTVPAYPWLWSSHDVLHHHYRRYTSRMLRERLESSGFVHRQFAVVTPPAPLNSLFYTIFRWEGRHFDRQPPSSLPAGLSLLATARTK
jgi:SAM-dependent methyltransferase